MMMEKGRGRIVDGYIQSVASPSSSRWAPRFDLRFVLQRDFFTSPVSMTADAKTISNMPPLLHGPQTWIHLLVVLLASSSSSASIVARPAASLFETPAAPRGVSTTGCVAVCWWTSSWTIAFCHGHMMSGVRATNGIGGRHVSSM